MEERKKIVLLTGASSGIGRQIAIGLSAAHNLILNGRNMDRLHETKEQCANADKHLIFQRDLSSAEGLEEDLAAFMGAHQIEICQFVHCAGIMRMVPLKMLNPDIINTTFTTNITSAVLILKVLVNRKFNNAALTSVVFISSNISNFGAKAFNIYGASKSGLDGLMRSLAVELAPKIRVNSVLPGAIRTEMTETIFANQDTVQRMEATYPMGLGNPKDIFEMVEFLLSEKSRWITGQQITIDGGRTINITG